MMTSLKVTHRLLLGFIVLIGLCVVLGAIVWGTSAWQAERLNSLRTAGMSAVDHAAGMYSAAGSAYDASVELLTGTELEGGQGAATAVARIERAMATFGHHLDARRNPASGLESTEVSRLDQIEEAASSFERALTTYAQIARNPSVDEMGDERLRAYFATAVRPTYADGLEPLLSDQLSSAHSALDHRIESAQAAGFWSRRFAVGGVLVLLVTIGGIALVSTRKVGSGLDGILSAARGIASGQLTNPLRVRSDDEFGEITESLNQLVVKLSTATVSRMYVENIVENMADPLVVVDSDICISTVNPALLELLGYEANQILGASVSKIFAHSGRGRGNAIKKDIERGLSGNVESEFRTSSGQTIPVSLSSAIVRANDQVQGLVLVIKDITAQKQREEDLIRSRDEAERMLKLRDAFLANMSHEIRTPLTGILGSAQVLAEVVEGEHRNLACIIEDAGGRLLDTINSVLEMARIEAGEVQPEMEVLDFGQEATAVANVLRPVAKKKGLSLDVHLPERGVIAAQLDRSCLNRILNNLIGNAIKFTPQGGVSIEVDADGDDAMITVRDTGVGITKEFLPHLFDDFKQESTGLKRSHEGTGLGLAITRKLIDMMGGSIHVDSVKGLGSAFTIRFERAPLDAVAAPASQPEPIPQRSVQTPWDEIPEAAGLSEPEATTPSERPTRDILLIEDNHQNAYMARFMLEGYEADIATTPEEALDLARRFTYRVLLIDINLGADLSGIELLATFRKDPGYSEVPAVAVTAYALPGDRERFLEAGFDDYVSKPYRKELLRAAVEKAFESRLQEPQTDLDDVLEGTFDGSGTAQPNEQASNEPVVREGGMEEPEALESTVEEPADSYPTASPDEFLPSNFRPDQGAFTTKAAQAVRSVEKFGDPAVNPAETVAADAESSRFRTIPGTHHATREEGDGASRPPVAPS